MAFSLVTAPNPVTFKKLRHNAKVFTIGDVVVWDRTSDAYDVTRNADLAASTLNLCGIAMQTTTSADSTVLVALIDGTQEWKCKATNATNTNHNGLRSELTNAGEVNNAGTDTTKITGIFLQTGVASATEVVGKFIPIGQVTVNA